MCSRPSSSLGGQLLQRIVGECLHGVCIAPLAPSQDASHVIASGAQLDQAFDLIQLVFGGVFRKDGRRKCVGSHRGARLGLSTPGASAS